MGGECVNARLGPEFSLISGDPLLPKLLGLKASRRIPLFNGPIEPRFLQYKLIAGSMRPKKASDDAA